MNLKSNLLLLISLASATSFAQSTFKYGKISEEELKMTECTFDKDASAMVLFEEGTISFKYHSESGFQYQFEYVVRMKIFNQEAANLANVEIKTYEAKDGSKEEVGGIKASSYNLVNGKIVESKLERSEQLFEKINERWQSLKFAIPGVVAGSVIEYRYTITSDFLSTLRPWQFEREIPVNRSEFTVTTPEYFTYQKIFRGFAELSANESLPVRESFQYSVKETQTGMVGPGIQTRTGTFESNSSRNRWVAEKLPGLKQEPFMTNINDYAFQVEFQLQMIKFPNEPPKEVAGSYDKINKELLDNSSFGLAISKGDFSKEILSNVSKAENPKEYAINIYEFIKTTIHWNEMRGIFTTQSVNQTLKQKKGSVADINFLLVSVLRDAGFQAHPIILSTRQNGKMHPVYPSYDRMDYMVAGVIIDDKLYVADASARFLHFNLLKESCLNGEGYMVMPTGGQWVPLQNTAYSETTFVKLSLENDELKGTIQSRMDGYAAIKSRSSIIEQGEEKYNAQFDSQMTGWDVTVNTLKYQNLYEPVNLDMEVNMDASADKIYLSPVLLGLKENPFKEAERINPVDFPYPIKTRYTLSLAIPDNYQVVELPKPATLALPDKAGSYRFIASQAGNTINVSIQFDLSRLYYTAEEYAMIQSFYSLATNKNSELIVLSKL